MTPQPLPLNVRAQALRRAHDLRDRAIADAWRWLWQRLQPARRTLARHEEAATCRS